nr:MAG TPA: hypothetical protein [Caudoviricetes sp.]
MYLSFLNVLRELPLYYNNLKFIYYNICRKMYRKSDFFEFTQMFSIIF